MPLTFVPHTNHTLENSRISKSTMPIPTYNTTDAAQEAKIAETSSTAQEATGAGVNTGAGTTREKTEAEREADRLYEERMEEEYAKREGGA